LAVVVGGLVFVAGLVALDAAADAARRGSEDRCFRSGGLLSFFETRVDWRLLPPGYECVYRHRGRTLARRPPSDANLTGRAWRMEDFVEAGLPVPGTHPTLPFCSEEQLEPDTGFETLDPHSDEPANPTGCQAPRTAGIFELSPRRHR